MIHEIGRELEAELRAQGCPLAVYDGPEALQTSGGYFRERIVIEHDAQARDTFTYVLSQRTNPKQHALRHIATKISVYAQAADAGATPWEHRRKAEHVIDLIVVALDKLLRGTRKNGFTITGGGFFRPEDLADSEVDNGAAYALTLTIERGIREETYKYAIRPEVVVGTDVAIVQQGSASAPGFPTENI